MVGGTNYYSHCTDRESILLESTLRKYGIELNSDLLSLNMVLVL